MLYSIDKYISMTQSISNKSLNRYLRAFPLGLRVKPPLDFEAASLWPEIVRRKLNPVGLSVQQFHQSLELAYKFHQFETSFQSPEMKIERYELEKILSGDYVDFKYDPDNVLYKRFNFLSVDEIRPRINDLLYVMNGLRPKEDALKIPLAFFYAVGPVSDLAIGKPDDPHFNKAAFTGLNIPVGTSRYFVPWSDNLQPLGLYFRVWRPDRLQVKRYAFCAGEPFFYEYDPTTEERKQFVANNNRLLTPNERRHTEDSLDLVRRFLIESRKYSKGEENSFGQLHEQLNGVEFKIAGPLQNLAFSGGYIDMGFHYCNLKAEKVYNVIFSDVLNSFAAQFFLGNNNVPCSTHFFTPGCGFQQVIARTVDEKGRINIPHNFREMSEDPYPPFDVLAALRPIFRQPLSPES